MAKKDQRDKDCESQGGSDPNIQRVRILQGEEVDLSLQDSRQDLPWRPQRMLRASHHFVHFALLMAQRTQQALEQMVPVSQDVPLSYLFENEPRLCKHYSRGAES